MSHHLTIASYNIHRGVGIDRRFRPARNAAGFGEHGADVIALLVVGSRAAGFDMLQHLAEATGFGAVAGMTLTDRRGDFGNALLTHLPVVSAERHCLRIGAREPRGALLVVLAASAVPLRVIVTHLGLRTAERHEQVARLLALARKPPDVPTILAGDMNVWGRAKQESKPLDSHFGSAGTATTFPSFAPCLALDRIWMHPVGALVRIRAHRSPKARIASDHLPLVAQVHLPAADAAEGS
jgi:endonuclease/exonuclease/phosphatase family metal-dependent hydrolase